jgi:hypothetical protein
MSPDPRPRRAAILLLLVCPLLALGACTAGQRQPSYPIGQDQAAAVVRSYAAAWAQVVSRHDLQALARIQTGAALAASTGELKAREGTGEAAPAAPTASEIKVLVPPSGSRRSPARFLALVTWSSPEAYPDREALEFQRAGPDSPWQIETRAKLTANTPPPAVAADRDGRAGTVEASKLRFSGRQVVETLSGYYSDEGQGDDPVASLADTLVAPGPFTSGLVKRRKQSNDSFQFQRQYKYRPGTYRTPAYRLRQGGGLMLVSLSGTRRMFPKDPNVVTGVQQDASRRGLGGLVPPGQYTSLTFHTTMMLAVEVPPAKSRGQLHVVGIREVDVSIEQGPP